MGIRRGISFFPTVQSIAVTDARQVGQRRCIASHSSAQREWKAWLHDGSSLFWVGKETYIVKMLGA